MDKFFKQKKNRKVSGFTLIETLVAISIFSTSILTLIMFLSSGVSDIGFTKKKIVANFLAQEGIEYLRNMRDNYIFYTDYNSLTWNSFISKISSCDEDCGFDLSVAQTDDESIFLCSDHVGLCELYIENGNYNTNLEGVDSGFARSIKMAVVSSGEIKVFSTVSWSHNDEDYSVTLTENLFDWSE